MAKHKGSKPDNKYPGWESFMNTMNPYQPLLVITNPTDPFEGLFLVLDKIVNKLRSIFRRNGLH